MSGNDSPLKRPIGLRNLVRGIIALCAVLAIGAALAAGRTDLAEACFEFLPTRAQLDLLGWGEEDIFAHS